MKKNTVCLVGRPNVGKSTLFNRMVGKKISIIEDTPGVTRDRIYGEVNYNNYKFNLIDTGGIDIQKLEFNKEIKAQAEIAISESDVIVFIVDGKEGLTSNDLMIRDILRKSNKKVIVAINKIDSKKTNENKYDFYTLGLDEYLFLSAEHNVGISDLLDKICESFCEVENFDDNEDILKFCLIGRPNVGKSSLVNAILNEERSIVSDIPGTTRDSIDTKFTYEKKDYIMIDTAGMRKKGRIFEMIEKYSLIRSFKAIDRSDVCVLVIDAEEGIVEHDKHIASYAIDAGKVVVIAVNKWDLIEDKDKAMKKWKNDIAANFQFMPWAKIVFLSALTKKKIHTLMPEILSSYQNYIKEIKTSVINEVVTNAYIETPPPSYKCKRLKIYFSHQNGIKPPRFDIEVNSKGLIHFSYERYLENKIRENIDLKGTPIIINFKNKGEK